MRNVVIDFADYGNTACVFESLKAAQAALADMGWDHTPALTLCADGTIINEDGAVVGHAASYPRR